MANAMAVDATGNVFVTGLSTGNGTGWDYATVKYNNSGKQLWVARYNGPGNGDDVANSLVLDSKGNVYITGWSVGNGTSYDYATIKYDNTGTQLWLARYNGSGNGEDLASSLAVDSAGNVYVTGWSTGSNNDVGYTTIKYDNNGNQLWVALYKSSGNGNDFAPALAVDMEGNVYVTGEAAGTLGAWVTTQ
jgi:Beta-propeller repeat